ncbi:MAG: hypothetical protein K9N07_08765 [Candidatus Cloacimonetes bacterium]|nr:hypothetical protein [Candidatus Cloacimonadota bacterium]
MINWLLSGDVSIKYQTRRDLLETEPEELEKLQKRIALEGWGKAFLAKYNSQTGQWGNGWYTPKWISTHYTLLELKNIGIHPETPQYKNSAELLLEHLWYNKGGIRPDRMLDLCIVGMMLGICCYTAIKSPKLNEMVDYILAAEFEDGGWNCRWELGAHHSSLHTTISILEGIQQYEKGEYKYRINELLEQRRKAHEFILQHRLYKSDKTGKSINKNFTMLSFPGRWYYNILRCLDYFQSIDLPYDERMQDALELLLKKQRKSNRWPLQHKIPGLVHFDMEQIRSDSRWNTLRALRVLEQYSELLPYSK